MSAAQPSPTRRERRRDETLEHLADTAWELFTDQGFEAVTMEAIAEAADVAKGTLYKHFPVKEALLRHRFHREMADGLPALMAELGGLPSASERLRRFFQRSAVWIASHRDFMAPYLGLRLRELHLASVSQAAPAHRSGMNPLFTGLIASGQASGEFRSPLEPTVLAQYLQSLHLVAALRWLALPDRDLAAEFDQMLDLFLNGLKAPA